MKNNYKLIKIVIPAFVAGGVGFGVFELVQNGYNFSPQFSANALNQNHVQFQDDGMAQSNQSGQDDSDSLEQDRDAENKFKENKLSNAILFQNKNNNLLDQSTQTREDNVLNNDNVTQEIEINRNPTTTDSENNNSSQDQNQDNTTIIVDPSKPSGDSSSIGRGDDNKDSDIIIIDPNKPSDDNSSSNDNNNNSGTIKPDNPSTPSTPDNPNTPDTPSTPDTPTEITPTRPSDARQDFLGGDGDEDKTPSFPDNGLNQGNGGLIQPGDKKTYYFYLDSNKDNLYLSDFYVFHDGETITEEKILYSFNAYAMDNEKNLYGAKEVYRYTEFDGKFFRIKSDCIGKKVSGDSYTVTLQYRFAENEKWQDYEYTFPIYDTSVYIYTDDKMNPYIRGMNIGDTYDLNKVIDAYYTKNNKEITRYQNMEDTYTPQETNNYFINDEDEFALRENGGWKESLSEIISGFYYKNENEGFEHSCQISGIEQVYMNKEDINSDKYKVYWIQNENPSLLYSQCLVHVDDSVEDLVIPEGIKYVHLFDSITVDYYPDWDTGEWIPWYTTTYQILNLNSITIPQTVANIDYLNVNDQGYEGSIFVNSEYIVDQNNESYSSVDGSIYNKQETELYNVPLTFTEVTIPDTVTQIPALDYIEKYHLSSETFPTFSDADADIFDKVMKNVYVPDGLYLRYYINYFSTFDVNVVNEDGVDYDLYLDDQFLMSHDKTILYRVLDDVTGTVEIPDTVQIISANAFINADKVRKVMLSSSNQDVFFEDQAFASSNIKEIYIDTLNPVAISHSKSSPFESDNVKVYVPKNQYEQYYNEWKEDLGDQYTQNILQGEDIEKMEDQGFTYLNKNEGLVLLKAPNDLVEFNADTIQSIEQKTGSKVIEIDGNAFKDNSSLEFVELPESIKKIGIEAFKDCISLAGFVSYSKDTIEVEGDAFINDNYLDYMAFSAKEANFENDYNPAFAYDYYLDASNNLVPSYIDVYRPVDSIGYPETSDDYGYTYTFDALIDQCYIDEQAGGKLLYSISSENNEKTLLRGANLYFDDVSLLDNTTVIGFKAFKGSYGITLDNDSLKNVREIGDEAFFESYVENTIVLPSSLEYLGASVFNTCIVDGDMSHLDKLTELNNEAFYAAEIEGNLILPPNTVSIGNFCFGGESESSQIVYKELILPDSLESIGLEAFRFCNFSNGIQFNDSITSLGQGAFYGCYIGGDLNLPSSLVTTGQAAFSNCIIEGNISIQGAPTVDKYCFKNSTIDGNVEFGEGVQNIGEQSFYYTQINGSVNFPHSLETIGQSAFFGSSFSGKVELLENVQSVAMRAFYGCRNIDEVYIDGSNLLSVFDPFTFNYIDPLDREIFSQCSNLKKVTFSDHCQLETWNDYFSYTAIEEITLPASINKFASGISYDTGKVIGCFDGCKNLKIITLQSLSIPELNVIDFYSYYDDNGNYGSNEGEDYGFRFGCEDNEEFKVVLPEGQEDEYRNVWKYALLGYMQNTESPNYDDEKANALFNQIIGLNKESEVDERID